MVDLTQTATSVVKGTGAVTRRGILGETVAAGMPIVRDPTTRKMMKNDSDGAAALRGVDGIALNGGAVNQPVEWQESGLINLGATLVIGTVYVASDTPGGIMPAADLEAGDYPVVLGVAQTAALLNLKIVAGGAAVPA